MANSNRNNSIDLAITTENYPNFKITVQQFQLIEDYILSAIDSVGFNNNFSPKFDDATLINGVVHIHCVDMQTANWLCPKIQDKSVWGDEKLQICVATDLPQYIKVTFHIPEYKGDPNEVLKQIQTENIGLSIKLWSIINVKNTINGQDLLIWIDSISFDYLKRHNYLFPGKSKKVVYIYTENINQSDVVTKHDEGVSFKKELLNLSFGGFGVDPNIFL